MSKQELHPRTAILNKSQKNHAKKLRLEALHWLAQRFPLAFDNTIRIRPLKTGILTDILAYAPQAAEEGISKAKLREAVVIFTRRLDYLTCLKARDMRVDLLGNEANEVSSEEAEHAAAKIRKRVEKSARNARKLLAPTKANAAVVHNNTYTKSSVSQESNDSFPIYPARQNSNAILPAKASSVTVRHKATKQYDPSAVARLKEKLGLSRAAEEGAETVE